jgi:NADH:ubiquinone oxidoreductase subunit D
MEFYERVSGARMHAAFYRPNEVNTKAISSFLIEDIVEFIRNCFTTLSEIHNSLTYNKLWKQRLVNIGSYSHKTAIDYGLTGVMSRSVGIKRDLRLSKVETYSNYYYLNFRSFIGQHGDCYDRFLIRMNEMSESLNICNQVIYRIKTNNNINKSNTSSYNRKIISNKHEILNYLHINSRKDISSYSSMEEIIKHFKF